MYLLHSSGPCKGSLFPKSNRFFIIFSSLLYVQWFSILMFNWSNVGSRPFSSYNSYHRELGEWPGAVLTLDSLPMYPIHSSPTPTSNVHLLEKWEKSTASTGTGRTSYFYRKAQQPKDHALKLHFSVLCCAWDAQWNKYEYTLTPVNKGWEAKENNRLNNLCPNCRCIRSHVKKETVLNSDVKHRLTCKLINPQAALSSHLFFFLMCKT